MDLLLKQAFVPRNQQGQMLVFEQVFCLLAEWFTILVPNAVMKKPAFCSQLEESWFSGPLESLQAPLIDTFSGGIFNDFPPA